MITIAIAEDHQALIDGIMSYLQYEEDIRIVGHANDGEALLEIVRRKQPRVIICDIRMPKLDGIAATKIIKKEFPHLKVLAFTMFEQKEAVRQMLNAGASGYITKNSSLEVVLEAIHALDRNETYYDAKLNIKEEGPKNSSKSLLTKRENEILALIAQRKTSLQIAKLLFIGKSTVDTHRKNMIRKLNLSGSNELLAYAIEKKYQF